MPKDTNAPVISEKWWMLLLLVLMHMDLYYPHHQLQASLYGVVMLAVFLLSTRRIQEVTLAWFLWHVYPLVLPAVLIGLPAISFLIAFGTFVLLTYVLWKDWESVSWLRRGRLDRLSWVLVVLTGVFSTVALITWAMWSNNLGLGVKMVKGLSNVPKWLVLGLGIPLFALSNAFAEEVIFRGILQSTLEKIFASLWWVLLAQASVFATAHFLMGFPNGWIGFLMVLVYGFTLGYLKHRTEGFWAPYIAHVIADLTIGYTLCYVMWFR